MIEKNLEAEKPTCSTELENKIDLLKNEFSTITFFFFHSTMVTHPSGLSPHSLISSLSDDSIEVDSG